MMNKLTNVIIFSVGAAIGSAVTWKLVKTKYERIANEEIESVKEMYSEKLENGIMPINYPDVNLSDDSSIYPDTIVKEEYKNEASKYQTESEEKEVEEDVDKPYVISPTEFDDGDYEVESLTYYADGVLVDDDGNIIEDVDDLVGKESLTHFGEYENDSVFVRNDKYKTDYEILLDTDVYKAEE